MWTRFCNQAAQGQTAYVATALLQDGLLEYGLTLPCVNQVIHFLVRRLLASHNVHPPLYHLPALHT